MSKWSEFVKTKKFTPLKENEEKKDDSLLSLREALKDDLVDKKPASLFERLSSRIKHNSRGEIIIPR